MVCFFISMWFVFSWTNFKLKDIKPRLSILRKITITQSIDKSLILPCLAMKSLEALQNCATNILNVFFFFSNFLQNICYLIIQSAKFCKLAQYEWGLYRQSSKSLDHTSLITKSFDKNKKHVYFFKLLFEQELYRRLWRVYPNTDSIMYWPELGVVSLY